MTRRKRHSRAEVAAKLARADALAAQGKLHSEIAQALGISLMTYHRWRKARHAYEAQGGSARLAISEPLQLELGADQDQRMRIEKLELENARLRRLVADLLLEQVEREEALHGTAARRGKA